MKWAYTCVIRDSSLQKKKKNLIEILNMPHFNKQKRHLSRIRSEEKNKRICAREKREELGGAEEITRSADVVYVSVTENIPLDIYDYAYDDGPEAWKLITEEDDSEAATDCDTEDEDWSINGKAPSKKEDWTNLTARMQEAALTETPVQRYVGNSRATIYRKKKILNDAAKGTKSLFSFGFSRATKPTNHSDQDTLGNDAIQGQE